MVRIITCLLLCAALAWVGTGLSAAQDPKSGTPGVITQGSSNTSIGGQAAARRGDATDGGTAIVQGSSNVFINGKPATTLGDKTGCGGTTIGGAGNVFINGKPAARAGDLTSGCAEK
jgi:uncharacterized Zn-binding protein involved in type VI secretion